jgi:hypothetical protein
VSFTNGATTYTVNGTSKAYNSANKLGWHDIDEIWADSPNPELGGPKTQMVLIADGLKLCG